MWNTMTLADQRHVATLATLCCTCEEFLLGVLYLDVRNGSKQSLARPG